MSQETDTALLLGEVRGQLRELIHSMNNQKQERDAIVRQLAKLEVVPERLEQIEKRLSALELVEQQRSGIARAGNWFLNSPLPAWIIAVGALLWEQFKGAFGK